MFETLEARRLMSAAPALPSSSGDAAGNLTITVPYRSYVTVSEAGGKVAISCLSTACGTWLNIKKITIVSNGGDSITFTGQTMGAAINGKGSDTINVTDPAAPSNAAMPASVVHAGAGRDHINVLGGYGASIYGDRGANTIALKAGSHLQVFSGGHEIITATSSVNYSSIFYKASDSLKDAGSHDTDVLTK